MNNSVRDSLEIGTKLNNYVIQAILGRGAFGITYLARDENLDYFVAIKEYLPRELAVRDNDMTVCPFSVKKSAKFRYGLESFLREAQTIAKFKHPNIVRVLSFFRKNKTAYIVMEYEKGKTLKSYVEEKNDLSEQRLLDIFCPINDGLLLVHQQGYIHRDIKPDNIVIREDNTPVLIDFGTARDTLNSNSADLTQIFTSGYAPFEQCHPTWAEQGPWTDIYSLGATLHFAITGKRIIASELRMVNDPYQQLVDSDDKAYSEYFLKAVDDALLFQPRERPQNLEEWNAALGSHFKQERSYTYSKTTTIRTGTGRRSQNSNTHENNFRRSDKTVIYGSRTIDKNLNIVEVEQENDASLLKWKIFFAGVFLVLMSLIFAFYYFRFGGLTPLKDSLDPLPIATIGMKNGLQSTTQPQVNSLNLVENIKYEVPNSLPEEIKQEINKLIKDTREELSRNDLNFSDTVTLCNNINKHLNKFFHKKLREVYLTALQKSLDFVPLKKPKNEHIDWIKIHKNNIIKDDVLGKYVLNPDFSKAVLEEVYLYGKLIIESPNIILNIEILGNDFICTQDKSCKTPLNIKKIISGEKTVTLNNKFMGINANNTINIHPHQEYILYIE